MSKKAGFLVIATYFVPIDKSSFAAQAKAFADMDTITKTGKLPDGFAAPLVSVKAKRGAAEIADTSPAGEDTQPGGEGGAGGGETQAEGAGTGTTTEPASAPAGRRGRGQAAAE